MSETPKLPGKKADDSLVPFKQALFEFIDDARSPELREEAEAQLKKFSLAVDATRGVQSALKDRQDIIDRWKEGEEISPEAISYSGELLLEAQMEDQRVRGQLKLPIDIPPS